MSSVDVPRSGTLPVTVIIPAHEREATIARAVRSTTEQAPYPPAEVIVVDDCSSDDTSRVAREAGARVIRHDVNRGAGAARNTGIANATQPWVALLDSDDEWLPHHLATLWPQRDGHVLLSAAALRRMPSAHEYVGTAAGRARVVRSPLEIAGLSFFAASGVVVRRDVVADVGGFRPIYGVEDLDLWLRVLERGTALVSPVVSVIYHVHEGQVSGDSDRMEAGHRAVLASYRARPWFRRRALHRWDAVVAWDAARAARRAGDRRAAARHIGSALRPPARAGELALVLLAGRRRRRRTWRYAPSGAPTLAVVGQGGLGALAAGDDAGGFAVVRPAGATRAARWLAVCRRPASAVLVEDTVDRALARALRMRPLRAPRG